MKGSGENFRYKKLSDEIEAKIRSGTFRPGEKLPSIRKLHRDLKLSITTIYQAYAELEKSGLVTAKPKSGYYVSAVCLDRLKAPVFRKVPMAPGRVKLDAMVGSVVTAINTPGLLPFGSSAMAPELLPHRQLSRILKSISAEKMRSLVNYSLTEGNAELRRQITLRTMGIMAGTDPSSVMVTNGCMEALALSLQAVTHPGDTVAIETPTHFGFLQLLKALGLLVVEVPTDPTTGIDVDEFEELISRTPIHACLLMPNFHNPLGARMPDAHKEKLVALAAGREIPVIEDDLCSELFHDGPRPTSLASFDTRSTVITCSSFSKTLAPGLRIGWVIAAKPFMEKIQRLKAGTTVATSTLDQYLICEYLKGGGYERHLRSLRGALKRQTTAAALAVQRYFPPGTRLAPPRGGNLLWVELPPETDGLALYHLALEKKISILPGVACDRSGRHTNYIRLGCGFPFTDEVERGIETLGNLAKGSAAKRS